MKIVIPGNLIGKDLFNFLIENKSLLITQKKSVIKEADAVIFHRSFISDKGEAVKAHQPIPDMDGVIKINPVINTTNWLDSHGDCHLPGIWKENLKRNPKLYLVQEHKANQFDKIISDELKAITKKMSWRDLGENIDGITEALIFSDTKITPKRNPFMYDQYRNGWVENHSVGMIYVNLSLAINDADYKEEFAEWNKYIKDVANRDDAEAQGYMWMIKEAKIVEGSAVPCGSNRVTPTLDNNMQLGKDNTVTQPPNGTVEQPTFDVLKAIKETKFI